MWQVLKLVSAGNEQVRVVLIVLKTALRVSNVKGYSVLPSSFIRCVRHVRGGSFWYERTRRKRSQSILCRGMTWVLGLGRERAVSSIVSSDMTIGTVP